MSEEQDPYAEDPNQSTRDSVVAAAKSQLGYVVAKEAGEPDESGRTTRRGWQSLKQYFDDAAPGIWHDDTIKYLDAEGLPSWCGIFALWSLHQGGASAGNWSMGSGIASVSGISQTMHPKPGDVGYFTSNQHHCIIATVDGDTIGSVDGNSGGNGSILEKTRSKSEFAGFYTAFG